MESKKDEFDEKSWEDQESEDQDERFFLWRIFDFVRRKKFLFLSIFSFFILFSLVGLYFYSPFGKFFRPFLKNVPYPIAIVQDRTGIITSHDLFSNAEALRNFYESQDYSPLGMRVDFSTEDGKKRLEIREKDVLDKLIENELLKRIANQKEIFVTQEEAEQEIKKTIELFGGDAASLALSLKSLYGWTMEDFRDKIVIHDLYLKKLSDLFDEQIVEGENYQKMIQAQAELEPDGSNFSEVAQKYSEGESAQNGGELGWFRADQLIAEVGERLPKMNEGEISEVILSPLGIHIIQLQETRQVDREVAAQGEGAEPEIQKVTEYKLRQIIVRGDNFFDWLTEEKQQIRVIILMDEYYWDEDEAQLRFKNQEMEKVENQIRFNSEGDPSVSQ